MTTFLESLGSLHIFAILGNILFVGGSRKGTLSAFLKFLVASGDRSCFIFSNQDGLFVISCSLAASGRSGIYVAYNTLLPLEELPGIVHSRCCRCKFCERH
jgi:hypothetical protein